VENLTLFIAPPGARNKREHLFQGIIKSRKNTDYSSTLYLVPNTFIGTEAKRQFFSYQKKVQNQAAYIPFYTLTVKQFSSRIINASDSINTISAEMRTILIHELLEHENLGYASLLSALFSKIIHYIPDKQLSTVREQIGQLIFDDTVSHRATRAIAILENYEKFVGRLNLSDPDGLIRQSIQLLDSQAHEDPHSLSGIDSLVIDGFFDPTPLERQFITSLIKKVNRADILVEKDTEFCKYLQSAFSKATINRLDSKFHRKKSAYYSYASMEDEIEGIAREAKRLILNGSRPWDIIVTFPRLQKYLPMVKRVFSKHGIPLSISSQSISSTPPANAINELLNCIEDNYSRNSFLSVLTSPHFPKIQATVREWAVTLSYRAGIIRGKSEWMSLNDTLLNSSKEELSEDDKKLLSSFQKEINLIIALIENIKTQKGLASFAGAFDSVLNRLGFFDSIDEDMPSPYSQVVTRIGDVIAELRRLSELNNKTSHGPETALSYMRFFLQDLQGHQDSRDGIRIIPFELAAGTETEELFFGGLLEGELPSSPDIDPVLPEEVKKELGLPYIDYYLKRQRLYFGRLLNIPSSEPYLSCPAAEGDKIFLPSPYLEWDSVIHPPDSNIVTQEETLVQQGAAKYSEPSPGFFGNSRLKPIKPAEQRNGRALFHRITALSKGYFSVTDIDFYRKCPLRFYIEKVLGLEMETAPRFEIEYRLWGILAHRVMEYVFRDGEFDISEIETRLLNGLEAGLKNFPSGEFWKGVAREVFMRLLPLLRERESEMRQEGFTPYVVEKKLRAEIDGLRLKGKVDRVDIKKQGSGIKGSRGSGEKNGQGTTDNSNTVRLLDYKTGNIDSESLQLSLYALMWQKNFPEPVEKTGFYSLKDGQLSWYPKKSSMEENIKGATEKTLAIVTAIKRGEFPAEPSKVGECRFCNHRPLCNHSN
jgi:ATP-dependent helicase/nuclease subunit B